MEDNKYLKDSDNTIYKVMPNYLLKLSPWKDGEDRRVYNIDYGNYEVINYKNACMIINKQFDNTVESWDKYGKKYIANSLGNKRNVNEHSYMISNLPNHKVFLKDTKNILKYSNSVSISSEDGSQELKLIRHKGKIYYILIINEYLPRVKAYNLFGEFCQWIGIDHCKPIYCETDNRYI